MSQLWKVAQSWFKKKKQDREMLDLGEKIRKYFFNE